MKDSIEKTYWNSINTSFKNYPSLGSDLNCDVLIVGGGLAGCLTAYYLSRYNLDVVLIEKNRIASGSTNKSISSYNYGIGRPIKKLFKPMPNDDATRAIKLCQKSIDDLELLLSDMSRLCDFKRLDNIYISSEASLEKNYKLKSELDLNIELLNSDNLFNNFSIKASEAIINKRCAVVDPIKLCHSVLKAASAKNCKVYEETPLLSLDYSENKIRANTKGNRIYCSKVVFATGAVTNSLIKDSSINISNSYGIVSSKLKQPERYNKASISLVRDDIIMQIRPTEDNRLAALAYIPQEFENSDSKGELNPQILLNILKSLIPELGEITADYSWVNTLVHTKDNLPYIGVHPKFPNCYFNLPYGDNSDNYSIIGAQIVKDLILYNNNPDARLFKFNR